MIVKYSDLDCRQDRKNSISSGFYGAMLATMKHVFVRRQVVIDKIRKSG